MELKIFNIKTKAVFIKKNSSDNVTEFFTTGTWCYYNK